MDKNMMVVAMCVVIGIAVIAVVCILTSNQGAPAETDNLIESPNPSPAPYCGDGACNNRESCANCSQDCGQCPPSADAEQHTCKYSLSDWMVDSLGPVTCVASPIDEVVGKTIYAIHSDSHLTSTNILCMYEGERFSLTAITNKMSEKVDITLDFSGITTAQLERTDGGISATADAHFMIYIACDEALTNPVHYGY